jgi:hypothetical protein
MATVPAPAALTVALTSPAIGRIGHRASVEIEQVPDEKMPEDDDAGLAAAADEFGKRAQDVPRLKIGDLLRSSSRDDAARHDCSSIHVCQHSDAQHGIQQLHYSHDNNASSARFS